MRLPVLNENCPTNAATAEAALQDAIEEMRRVYAETEIIPCVISDAL